MLDIYAKRCVKGKFFKEKYTKPDDTKIKNFLAKKLKDGDWYMNSHDAVYYGFADKVIEDWANKICREYGIRAIIYAASDVITFFPCRQYPGATVQAWGEI